MPKNKESITKERPKKRLSGLIIAGIAVFVAVLALVLIPGGWKANGNAAYMQALAQNTSAGYSASQPAGGDASSAAPQALTAEQQALLDEFTEKFPQAMGEQAKLASQNRLFLAAAGRAQFTNPVFDDTGLTVTVLFPNPNRVGLDALGIGNYSPNTDAQAYIRDGYAKLLQMEKVTDTINFEARFFFRTDLDNRLSLDWTLQPLQWAATDYAQVFLPHMDQFMQEKGFLAAALEILAPDFQDWEKHAGADKADAAALERYCKGLADALEPEGITVNRLTLVDREKIAAILKSRFIKTWAYGTPSICFENGETYLKMDTLEPISLFDSAKEGLDRQYSTGSMPKPASFDALEEAFLDASKKQVNERYGDFESQKPETVQMGRLDFDWQDLGERGIAACPQLVSLIRTHLYSYDFSLLFLASGLEITP